MREKQRIGTARAVPEENRKIGTSQRNNTGNEMNKFINDVSQHRVVCFSKF